MKIAHCIWAFNTGGAETMLIDILNEQVKTEKVYLFIVNKSYNEELITLIDKRVDIRFINRIPGSRSPWAVIKLNMQLLKIRPDVVHIHNSSLPALLLRSTRRVLFMTVHALCVPLEHARHVNCLIAISKAVEEDILKRGDYNVATIPNGICTEAISVRTPHLIENGSRMRIIQVGRLEADKKGQDILIEAVASLKRQGFNNVEVDFIGEGESLSELQQLVKKENVADCVHFLGLKDRVYIYSHLKDYDMMCHPARYEGFGLTVAEGMATGLPVLVSDEGGPYEIIERGKLGYSFHMEDVEDCAKMIKHIYQHYDEALQFVKPAFEHVCNEYSIKRMVADYIKAYQKELKKREENNMR